MSEVKRYDISCFGGMSMDECGDGAYVNYEDYEALEAKCSALAAENAGLKAGILQASENMEAHHDDHGLFSYDADGEQMDALLRLCDAQDSLALLENAKTPATDAFLAEVRAQGVEMYADNLDNAADDAERCGFDYAVKFLHSEASSVRLFAAQLRKGGNQ